MPSLLLEYLSALAEPDLKRLHRQLRFEAERVSARLDYLRQRAADRRAFDARPPRQLSPAEKREADRIERDARIMHLYRAGLSNREIRARSGLSDSQIGRIIRRERDRLAREQAQRAP